MLIPLTSLMPGDILIIKYNDTYWHTMLVVTGSRLAHAPGPGLPCVIETVAAFAQETKADHSWSDSELLGNLYAYRYNEAMPNPSWFALAEQWCGANASQQITRYAAAPNDEQKRDAKWLNYPRYRGVLKGDDGHNALALPFGVDAFWRTIKWAKKYRYNEAFSLNRGTTCCAFIMACIQTSFVNAAIVPGKEGKVNLTTMTDFIDGQVRGPRQHTKGEANTGGALIAQSNRGLSAAGQGQAVLKGYTTDLALVTGLWAGFQRKQLVFGTWPEVGLPPALNYDAKYVYSRTFNHLLSADNTWDAK